jgi:hypothetical protein
VPPHDGSDMDHATWLNGPDPRDDEEISDADAFEALGQALVRALDRIGQRDDEAMGAALARRFGGE